MHKACNRSLQQRALSCTLPAVIRPALPATAYHVDDIVLVIRLGRLRGTEAPGSCSTGDLGLQRASVQYEPVYEVHPAQSG